MASTAAIFPRIGQRLLIAAGRSKAKELLTQSGFTLVAGPSSPLEAKRASDVIDCVLDEWIVSHDEWNDVVGGWQPSVEGFGDGKIIRWIIDHKEMILAVAKIIMMIAMLFI